LYRADDPLPTSGSPALASLLEELRALARGPAPAPSGQLEAIFAGDLGPAVPQRRIRRHRKSIAGAVVVGSIGAGLSGVAAAAADNHALRAAPVVTSSVAPALTEHAPAPRPGPSSLPATVKPRPTRTSPVVAAAPPRVPKPAHPTRPAAPTNTARTAPTVGQESTDDWRERVEREADDRTRESDTDHEESVARGETSGAEESDADHDSREREQPHLAVFRRPVKPE
jgi:type IV secretory pathway VirB10-like protein